MYSYRNLLNQPLSCITDDEGTVSVSAKAAAIGFTEIRNYNFRENPTIAELRPSLGAETAEDVTVLGTQTSQGPVMREQIRKEGDYNPTLQPPREWTGRSSGF